MININCTINTCIFQNDGKCTLTHVSTPSNVYNPECIYFRPKDETIKEVLSKEEKSFFDRFS